MVHLCNIQVSAASTKLRLKGTDYDIDGFVSQLFASRRFVELVDKLSEEAANRIQYNYKKKSYNVGIHEAPVYNGKGTERRSKDKKYDIDGFISQVLASKNIHELLAELTVNAASKIRRFNANSEIKTRTEKTKTNQVNNTKMKEELTGKIELEAIINKILSLSENPQLKYDNDESDTNEKVQSKEKTNKNDSQKKTIDLNKHWRDDAKGHYGKADPNRYSESSHSGHGGTDSEKQENSKKKYNFREEQGSFHLNSREAQNSELIVKGIVKQKTSHKDKSIREEENLSSLDEENHNPPHSEGKTNRQVAETENRSTDKKIIVNVGHEVSVKNNKMVSDDNPHREVYSSKGSEDSGDNRSLERPQERSLKDQRSKEQSGGDQVNPIIRIQGGKQYTYVQHADYAEYHEKMAEWRKTHPENATEFIF